MRYAVVIETEGDNVSAYVPDVPGCVATAPSAEAVEHEYEYDGRSVFISTDCAKTASQSPFQRVTPSLSIPEAV